MTRIFTGIVLLALGLLAAPVSAQPAPQPDPAPSEAEVLEAVKQATAVLVERQENYVDERRFRKRPPRRPRRRASEAKKKQYEQKLQKWQAARDAYMKKELARQAREAKKVGPTREWPYQGVYRVNDQIPSGYRVGGTAIACRALIESPGYDQNQPARESVARGIDFILRRLEKDPLLDWKTYEGGYDVRGWGHAYALEILLEVIERELADEKVIRRARRNVRWLIEALEKTALESGGWNYARRGMRGGASIFMTGPTLQALFKARSLGFEVSDAVVEHALDAMEKGRVEDSGAYQYAVNPDRKTGKGGEHPAGACARMSVAETTLMLAGRGSVDRLRVAVNAFFTHWEWLKKRHQQTGTHVAPYAIAPYYFYYAHTYAAQAIEMLPEQERPPLREKLRALFWKTREKDGTWNDRVFERSAKYGSAMAILALMMPEITKPAAWRPRRER